MMTEEEMTIGDVLQPRREKAQPSAHPELPYIGLEHVEAHTTRLLGSVPAHTMRSQANRFCAGDVLYSRLRPYLNKVWRADRDGLCSSEFILLPGNEFIDSTFLLHRLNARDFVQFANSLNAGDCPRVDFEQISSFLLPPFSLPHQRRIVAKVEELFSELDKGIENLKQARAQLAVYRQALLKHAFEGKLTADWRATHAAQLESAADGITNTLSELPKGWLWQRLANISAVSGGLTKNPKRESLPQKMKYLRVANVHADRLELDDVREIGVTEDEARRLVLEKGDLLVVEGNGSIDQIGRVAEWTGSIPDCGHQNHLIRARLEASILPRFALRFLQSPLGRGAIVKAASSTTGLHTLSISKVGNLSIPVAPFPEQEALLDLIEPAFDHVANLEADIELNLQRAEALRQSILKKAFAGELVPQDPADEPAAALLARIRSERVAASESPRGSRKATRKSSVARTSTP